ncbi:hypothetical protein MKS88_000954 [Plasmodium brasilianum]|uniref:Uncharacterized protein n=2 Tax=Plasmodium (Plasmodium) TaxID=418103 RepID=A0A1D3JIG2_PLAMA|nr:conserved Plasmodium protein, unknown function [Plasmodium malariae]KAI4840719.1 hypothetical protein MKS88_000954 [Plasmodium brasilianum]SBT86285.1 conserved Plasmodium protein, unknown function [Plasmodium malariae]
MHGRESMYSTSIYDYKNNFERFSNLELNADEKKGEDDKDRRKMFNEKLNESKSLTHKRANWTYNEGATRSPEENVSKYANEHANRSSNEHANGSSNEHANGSSSEHVNGSSNDHFNKNKNAYDIAHDNAHYSANTNANAHGTSEKNAVCIKSSNAFNLFRDSSKEVAANNNKLKNMFSGIIGIQMKHAKNVFEEVKEHIKYTAKEAKKNINYPFCKAPCNIENLKNTIFINEEEIIINKSIYRNMFTKTKEENPFNTQNRQNQQNGKSKNKKNEWDHIFTCNKSDIVIKGNYNFGFNVEVIYENEMNKIIVHAYDKETRRTVPCSYKWKRVYHDKHCDLIDKNLGLLNNGSIKGGSNSACCRNIYENEYYLTCEDIGLKIFVECSCIKSDQMASSNLSKLYLNSSGKPESRNDKIVNMDNSSNSSDGLNNDNNFYKGAPSFKSAFMKNKEERDVHNKISDKYLEHTILEKNLSPYNHCSDVYSGSSMELFLLSSSNYEKVKKNGSKTNEKETDGVKNIYGCSNQKEIKFHSYESSVFNNNSSATTMSNINTAANSSYHNNILRDSGTAAITSTTSTNGANPSRVTNGKYYGVAVAEIGPFYLNANTKMALEHVMNNDTMRYPIYILKKVTNNAQGINITECGTSKYYINDKGKIVEDITNSEVKKNDPLNVFDDYNSVDNLSSCSNVEGEIDIIYMLHIHKHEIKIIDQTNKEKHMWTYKFNHIYPYVEFIEKDKNYFLLFVNDKEYYICRCVYNKHRDIIVIILRYMHANLYILNDYIFNNINNANFESTQVKNIFNNVDVNSILENINKELLICQKTNQRYLHKINKLESEKNALEEDLKNTIEAFQIQLDNIKKSKDESELSKTNEKLMKEIKILQDKYRNVDLFFKSKYKILSYEIEKYKKLVEESKSKVNSKEEERVNHEQLRTLESEKGKLLNENTKLSSLYNKEKRSKMELENKLENLSLKLELLNKSLQEEKMKGNSNNEYLKEIEDLKKNNIILQQRNGKMSCEVNVLMTEKNRLIKLVDSLTRDMEKSKTNGTLRNVDNEMNAKCGTSLVNILNSESDQPHDKEELLKEILSLKHENDLLKKRIKKFAKFDTTL